MKFDESGPDSGLPISFPGLTHGGEVGSLVSAARHQTRISAPGQFAASNRRPLEDVMAANRPVGRAVARSYARAVDGDAKDDAVSFGSSADYRSKTDHQVDTAICRHFFLSIALSFLQF